MAWFGSACLLLVKGHSKSMQNDCDWSPSSCDEAFNGLLQDDNALVDRAQEVTACIDEYENDLLWPPQSDWTLWVEVLDGTCHHHRQNTNYPSEECFHPTSRGPETCVINAKVDWWCTWCCLFLSSVSHLYQYKQKDKEANRLWSLTKLYLHAHHFLYKLDYNSKWNTQEKYPLTSSREEARLIKGKGQRCHKGVGRGAGLIIDNEKETSKKWLRYLVVCVLFFAFLSFTFVRVVLRVCDNVW